MRQEELLTYTRARPFRPFRTKLSSGESHDITHPEFTIVSKHAVVIFKPSLDVPGGTEDWFTVALIHINSIEFLPAPAPAGSDGSSAKPK